MTQGDLSKSAAQKQMYFIIYEQHHRIKNNKEGGFNTLMEE